MGFPDALRLVLQGATIKQTITGCTVWQDDAGRLVCLYPNQAAPQAFFASPFQMQSLDWETVRGE